MIQLQYDTGSIENKAFWANQYYTGSELMFTLTSSFAGNYSKTNVYVNQNNTSATEQNGWIIFNISGSNVPTQSGHYEANIYDRISGSIITWATADDIWNTISQVWCEYSSDESAGELLATEKVFVTGSDYDQQYKYENNELAYYSVYNG